MKLLFNEKRCELNKLSLLNKLRTRKWIFDFEGLKLELICDKMKINFFLFGQKFTPMKDIVFTIYSRNVRGPWKTYFEQYFLEIF